jgi:hypothetical protein
MERVVKELGHIENPKQYYSAIHLYYVGHSMLLVQADKGKESGPDRLLYLTFTNVVFFEGPLQWQGVDFYLGTSDECTEMLNRIGLDKRTFDLYRLFKIKLEKGFINIVAMRVYCADTPPQELAHFLDH